MLINKIWIICSCINLFFLYRLIIKELIKKSTINYGVLLFYTLFSIVMAPVWTIGIVIYFIIGSENG